MFWDRFIKLCAEHNVKPNQVTKEIGLSTATATDWKKGSTPRDVTMKKLADYFGVSIEYLSGKQEFARSMPEGAHITTMHLSEKESRLLFAYRNLPEMQAAVDKLLGLNTEDGVLLYEAAKSTDNHPYQLTKMHADQWEAIKNAPETDEDLL